MFSCAPAFISLSFSRMNTNRGRACREYRLVMSRSSGVTITRKRVSRQLVKKKQIRVLKKMHTQSTMA